MLKWRPQGLEKLDDLTRRWDAALLRPSGGNENRQNENGVPQSPSEWMPWNYRETLARLARPAAA